MANKTKVEFDPSIGKATQFQKGKVVQIESKAHSDIGQQREQNEDFLLIDCREPAEHCYWSLFDRG